MRLERARTSLTGSIAAALTSIMAPGCSDSPTAPPPLPEWRRVAELKVPFAPRGLAVNERWIAVTSAGNSALTVFDAVNLRPVKSVPLWYPFAVIFSTDDDVALVGDVYPGDGFAAYRLPLGVKLYQAEVSASQFVASLSRSTLFMRGRYGGIYRTTLAGQVEASFETDAYGFSAMALSRDDRSLLVVFGGGRTAILLDASDLNVKRTIELPLRAEVVVPLEDPDRWLILGKPAGNALMGPLLAYILHTGRGELWEVARFGEAGVPLLFGITSPWAEVPGGRVLIPTSFGLLEFELASERVRLVRGVDLGGGTPCCEIAYDPLRERLLLTDVLGPGASSGRVRIYEVNAP